MKLGIQYYRPPNPDRMDWEIDYPNMKAAGLEVIRFWVPWRCVEPEQGAWDFDDYDRLFSLAEQHGLKVLVQLLPEAAPEWAIRAHPDKLYHNEHGPIHPFHATTVQVGGWPGLNFDYPETRAYFDAYTRAMAERYAGSEALYGWDVWNELQNGGVSHFDPANQRIYQEYLRLTYQAIAAYNQKYFTRYEDFSEIRLRPRDQQLQHEALEIHRFAAWRMTRELDHRVRAVKAVDSRYPVPNTARASPPIYEAKVGRYISVRSLAQSLSTMPAICHASSSWPSRRWAWSRNIRPMGLCCCARARATAAI